MGKFAKIIELNNGDQVLLYIEYNDKSDLYELHIKTTYDGIEFAIKIESKEREKALKAMENYEENNALNFRQSMIDLLD